MLLPFSLAIDAAVLATFGNTPGRALAGIRVQTIRHEPLDVRTALNRNARIYLFGMAIGLPLISLITYANNFSKLRKNEQTSWDKQLYTRVYNEGGNAVRTVLAAIFALGMTTCNQMLARMEEQSAASSQHWPATEGQSSDARSSDPLAIEMEKAAADIKPKMVDDITKLEGAKAQGRTITYIYTILRRGITDDAIKTFFKFNIAPDVCSD